MLPVRYFSPITVARSKQGYAPCKILFVLKLWLGVNKGMLPVRYFSPITVARSKQGYAPSKIL